MTKKAAGSKVSKNQRRRQKAKALKGALEKETGISKTQKPAKEPTNDADDEIVVEEIKIDNIEAYGDIINKFQTSAEEEVNTDLVVSTNDQEANDLDGGKDLSNDSLKEDQVVATTQASTETPNQRLVMKLDTKPQISKRKFLETHAVPLSNLKAIARPFNANVNWQDTNAPDPYMHVYLKTLHNVVPIPRHWISKKGFLSSKRGEQKGFELPSFIKATGIQDMRNTGDENDETLKARMRARVQPKSGQLDLDYHVLYDAFFKHQLKPQLLKYGELYYEGIDGSVDHLTERTMSQFRPGRLSLELQKALGISRGSLPPWYDNVRMMGPSPDYPGMNITDHGIFFGRVPKKHPRWGVLVDDLDSDSDKEDDDEHDNDNFDSKEQEDAGDYEAQKGDVILQSYGQSVPKKARQATTPSNGQPRDLYKILRETTSGDQSSMYGSGAKAYDASSHQTAAPTGSKSNVHPERRKEGSARKFRF